MSKQWTADIQVTQALADDLIRQQFPDLLPLHIEKYGEGWDNAVFLVNKHYIFRFPRRSVAVPLLLAENQALPRLSILLPVAIPTPIFFGAPTATYPYPFAGYEFLPGRAVHLGHLTDVERAQSASRFGHFLRELHQVSTTQAITWGIADSDVIGRLNLQKRVPILISNTQTAKEENLISEAEKTGILQFLEHLSNTSEIREEQRTVVHGDLNFRNFLIDEKSNLSGIVDWGDMHVGDPAVDLSVAYSFLPPHARKTFFWAYGEVDDEMKKRAQFRAIYTNLVILLYAHDIGDVAQQGEALQSVSRAIVQ